MKKILVVLVVAFASFACAPVEGEPVDYAKACDAEMDNKTIEVKGYLDDGGGLFCSNTSGRMECGFKFKKSLDQEDRGFSADIATGGGANAMDQVKSGYKKSDIVVRDNEGTKIDLSKEVTITGEQNSSRDPVSKDLVCYMKVYKIEQ